LLDISIIIIIIIIIIINEFVYSVSMSNDFRRYERNTLARTFLCACIRVKTFKIENSVFVRT